jgi:hypothetical protein
MTATDVIDQIKNLDPQERAKVLDVLLKMEADQKQEPVDDQGFDRSVDRVLDRHGELLRKLAQ